MTAAIRSFLLVTASLVAATGVAHAGPQPKPPMAHHPASSSNFTYSSGRKIDRIVIHKAEGSATATWSWFQNPRAQSSAHFVVDTNGQVTEMVSEQNIAWHAGNSSINARSIGIENAGYSARNDISDHHYRAMAKLCRYLCDKYGIPKNRDHIIGHHEVPDPDGTGKGGASNHTDPGPHFDWPRLMRYVNAKDEDPDGYLGGVPKPAAPLGGEAGGASAPPSGGSNAAQGGRPGGLAGGVTDVKDEIEGNRRGQQQRPANASIAKNDQKVQEIDWGDTLWDIAKKHDMTVEQLLALEGEDGVSNRDRLANSSPMTGRARKFDPNLIFPGQKLVLPKDRSSSASSEERPAAKAETTAERPRVTEFDEDERPRRNVK